MPEPLTLTLVSVTVISVAVFAYKSVDRIVSAPRETIRQAGHSTEEVIKTLAAEFKKLFGAEPRVSLNRRVVQTGAEAIRELALYKETVLISEEWQNTTWHSTKKLHVQQPFILKAGFDLNRLKIEVDAERRDVTVTVSDSTIVNIEYAGEYDVLKQEHGLWNRISLRERDTILNSLPEKARQQAESLKLRDKAAAQLQLFLRPLIPEEYRLNLRCVDDTLFFEEKRSLPSIPENTLRLLRFAEVEQPVPPSASPPAVRGST